VLEQHFHGGISLPARRALEIAVLDDAYFRRRARNVIGGIERNGDAERLGSLHGGFSSGLR